jgi:hypothetical protein
MKRRDAMSVVLQLRISIKLWLGILALAVYLAGDAIDPDAADDTSKTSPVASPHPNQ